MSFNDNVLKMSIIVTIQMMEKNCLKIWEKEIEFEKLWEMDYEELAIIRDDLVVKYNDLIEARKFGAEILTKGTKWKIF